jgi:hypothetical protein
MTERRVRQGVFLYPWDVVGDPHAAERIAALGVQSVSLAASYHTIRAYTHWHPRHRVFTAEHAAAYYRLREQSWAGRRLRPAPARWMADPDSFGSALAALLSVGLEVNAWVVLTHNSHLGKQHPELTVRNSYGDRYGYALCPSHPEVREYAKTVVTELVDQYPVAAVELEACGWLGFEHNGHHEKTNGADLTAQELQTLSICHCEACTPRLDDVYRLRADVIGGMLADIRFAVAGRADVLLMATDGWRHTGADVGVDLAAVAPNVEGFLLKCWGDTDSSAEAVKSAAGRVLDRTRLIANVTALPPQADLPRHAAAMAAAGATEMRYYHAGLVGPARLASIAAAVAEVAEVAR